MKTKADKIKTILEKVYGLPGSHIFVSQWKIDRATYLIMKIKKNKRIKK